MKQTKRAPTKKRRPAKTWCCFATVGSKSAFPEFFMTEQAAENDVTFWGGKLYRATVRLEPVETKGGKR